MSRFFEFLMHNAVLAGAFFSLLVAYIVVEVMRGGRSVSPQGLSLMVNNHQAIVVDVRDPAEFRLGHITGSRNIPYARLMEQLGELPADKALIIVCNMGQVAGTAARQLKAKGLNNVYKLEGGLSNWKSLSLPLVKR
ncbi:rhodanese-related sulfurtransferase [Fluviicoccus keumensis]|uniref:Rhodanese-related sulfurtransferase n=1 Tax=Fluviicoccus keumensis TaxID=1435465 RepID=A0A4Q7Z930_9GAMM|nr:rhodanese-like domain-containing protein [Fluviicoccus keumensis]RZU47010.1 rhodanese-related sulfurtransferase [Fluviicoccus keumensis]